MLIRMKAFRKAVQSLESLKEIWIDGDSVWAGDEIEFHINPDWTCVITCGSITATFDSVEEFVEFMKPYNNTKDDRQEVNIFQS
jgi:hypothetical protein